MAKESTAAKLPSAYDFLMPRLLKDRIREYDIPPWPGQATFDNILVYQVPDKASTRLTVAKDSHLVLPEMTVDMKKNMSPRGIIVSAGLRAMDIMRDHGMKLGEMVWYSPYVIHRYDVDRVEGKNILFFFMTIADVKTSEDIPQRAVDGELKVYEVNGKYTFREGDRNDPIEHDDRI